MNEELAKYTGTRIICLKVCKKNVGEGACKMENILQYPEYPAGGGALQVSLSNYVKNVTIFQSHAVIPLKETNKLM